MIKPRWIVFLLTAVVLISCVLAGCGDSKPDSTKDEQNPGASNSVQETTVVLETTAEGGTIEQDSEGNHIAKDKDGNVTSVEDKDGNPIDVTEYLSTHTWVENAASSGGNGNSSDSGSSGGSGKSSANGSGNSNAAGGNAENHSSDPKNEGVEDDIPVMIATIPDEEDLNNVPDL